MIAVENVETALVKETFKLCNIAESPRTDVSFCRMSKKQLKDKSITYIKEADENFF